MKVERLSSKEEKNLIGDEINRNNINTLKKVLKYFMLDKSSEKYVRDKLIMSHLDEKDLYIDNLFELNNQRRAFFKLSDLSEKNMEDINGSYKFYLNVIDSEYNYGTYLSTELYERIRNYKVFESNSIEIDGQVRKLFKYLLNTNICSIDHISRINGYNFHIEDIYICISRNPIDYIMISTNQSYRSCMGLDHSMEYLGFPGAFVDPNRYLMFFTDGKLHNYKLRPKCFIKHFKYKTRSWGLLLHDNILHTVKYYPIHINDKDVINTLFNNRFQINWDEYDDIVSQFHFKLPKIKISGEYSFPYIDSIGLNIADPNEAYYCNDRDEPSDEIIHDSNLCVDKTRYFYNLQDIRDIYHITKCENCNTDVTYFEDYNGYHNPMIKRYTCPKCDHHGREL